MKNWVDYLGFEVSPREIKASPEKVQAIIEWLKPKSVHDIRNSLRLASYYRRFVKGFSKKAGPLIALMRVGVELSTLQHQAFNKMKLALTLRPYPEAPKF